MKIVYLLSNESNIAREKVAGYNLRGHTVRRRAIVQNFICGMRTIVFYLAYSHLTYINCDHRCTIEFVIKQKYILLLSKTSIHNIPSKVICVVE